jgi:TetR/AcrR family transcriptional regulator
MTAPNRHSSASTASAGSGPGPGHGPGHGHAKTRPRDEARALFRNGILDAAERVFAEHGFHGARIQDIAEAAGTAVGTVYNHFDQKEDLLRALLDERTEALLAEFATLPGDPAAFGPRLVCRLRRMLDFVDQHRGFFALAMDAGLTADPPNATTKALVGRSMKRIDRFRAAFRAVVGEGVAEGALTDEIEIPELAAFLGSTLRAASLAAIESKGPALGLRAESIARLFLHGAATQPARRPATATKPGRPSDEAASVKSPRRRPPGRTTKPSGKLP